MEALPDMSWRRFSVLLRGLGPHSIFALLNSGDEKALKKDSKEDAIKAFARW